MCNVGFFGNSQRINWPLQGVAVGQMEGKVVCKGGYFMVGNKLFDSNFLNLCATEGDGEISLSFRTRHMPIEASST